MTDAVLHRTLLAMVSMTFLAPLSAMAEGSFLNRHAQEPPSTSPPPSGSTTTTISPVPSPAQPSASDANVPTPSPSAIPNKLEGVVKTYSPEGWPILNGQTILLSGIDAIAPSAQKGFAKFINKQGNLISCEPVGEGSYRCLTPQGIDIAQGAILNGGARASAEAPQSYRDAEQQARAAKRGIWR